MSNVHQEVLEGLYKGTFGIFFTAEELREAQSIGDLNVLPSKFLVRFAANKPLETSDVDHVLSRLEEDQTGGPYRLIMRAGRGDGPVTWKVLDSRYLFSEEVKEDASLDELAEQVVTSLTKKGLLRNYTSPRIHSDPVDDMKRAIEALHCLHQIYYGYDFDAEGLAKACAFSATSSLSQSYPSKRLEGLIKYATHPITGMIPKAEEVELWLKDLAEYSTKNALPHVLVRTNGPDGPTYRINQT